MIGMKTCVICTSEILDPMRKKTCSRECGDILALQRAKAEGERIKLNKPDIYVTCGCCGVVFLKKFRQVYCSDKCRIKVSRQHTAKQYVRLKIINKQKLNTKQPEKLEPQTWLQEC